MEYSTHCYYYIYINRRPLQITEKLLSEGSHAAHRSVRGVQTKRKGEIDKSQASTWRWQLCGAGAHSVAQSLTHLRMSLRAPPADALVARVWPVLATWLGVAVADCGVATEELHPAAAESRSCLLGLPSSHWFTCNSKICFYGR